MPSMDPQRLLALRAVHRTGSVAAAARALHLTPSGVSQHIAKLERETGLSLIDRSRRGGGRSVRLTFDGQVMAAEADKVAEALAVAEREASRLKDKTYGTVRIGGFASALSMVVAPAISALAVGQPAVDIQVVETDHADGVADLLGGRLDLLVGVRTGAPARPDGVVLEDLLRDPYRVVVPESWATPDEARALLAGPWVAAPRGQGSREVLESLCGEADIRPDARHTCTDSRTMLALVAAGLGAAVIPALTLSLLPTRGVRLSGAALDAGARVLTLLRQEDESPAAGLLRAHLHQHVAILE